MNAKPSLVTSWLYALPYLLVVITAIKIFVVTFHSPLMGYTNNYDFVRQSSCTGLWNYRQGLPKDSFNLEAPINSVYFDGDKRPDSCLNSTDNIFPYLVTLYHNPGQKVDFREIAFLKATFIIVGSLLMLALIKDTSARILLALAFLLIFSDYVNLLYLNTFYTEFSVISGCFLSLSTVAWIMSMTQPPNKRLVVLSLFSILWLGFSKQQYMPLASLLALTTSVTFYLRWRTLKSTAAFLILAILIPVSYSQLLNPRNSSLMEGMNLANKTDTFLAAVLPAATNKEQALIELSLPQTCLTGIGKDWYFSGLQQNLPCPEIAAISRLKLFPLFFRDPPTFFQPMHRATLGIYPFFPRNFGQLENPADANSPRYNLLRSTSLSTFVASVPKPRKYRPLIVNLSIFSGPIFFLVLMFTTRLNKSLDESIRLILAALALGGLTALYALASSVFGDGYCELQKHAVAFMIGFAFQISGLVMACITFSTKYRLLFASHTH